MKLLVYGDVHWCESSSIVRGMGNKYSKRLENLIESVSWVERTAAENKCSLIVMLGDFFDKSVLTAQEISALNDIEWSDIKKIFITGNHEIGRADRTFSTIDLFDSFPNSEVISQSVEMTIADKKCYFLPYFLEKDRPKITQNYDYIFSHNDIKGLQLGQFVSKEGFDIDEIEKSCKYFFNGHIHNGMFVGKNIINLGNLSGQNFSEDALTYSHNVCILDTETDELTFIENPYAFNFYKLGLINSDKDYLKLSLKKHAVVSATVNSDDEQLKHLVDIDPNIVVKRILYKDSTSSTQIDSEQFEQVDYLQKFVEFIKNNMEITDIVNEELSKVIA